MSSILNFFYNNVFCAKLCLHICFMHHFYLSMSSKAMLSVIPQALSSTFPVVLHIDCTIKCNDNEFPIRI
jgi:hypothetical protein